MANHFALMILMLASGVAVALPKADSLEKTLPVAQQEGRSILLDFTGTDWCPACIHLSNKILTSDVLEREVGDRYIVVSLDFSRKPELVEKIAPEERERRQKLLSAYQISGFPSVVVMDSQARPYGVIVGATQTPEEYLPRLNEVEAARTARDAALAKAEALAGVERAQALDAALKTVPEVCRDKYTDTLREIEAADPEDTLGYHALRRKTERLGTQQEAFQKLNQSFVGRFSKEDLDESVEKYQEFLKTPDLEPEVKQACLSCIADTYALKREFLLLYEYTVKAYEAAPIRVQPVA